MSDLVTVSILAMGIGSPDAWLGIEYQIAPGWHIYWENPGESGRPTTANVVVSDGLSVGEAVYPGPHRFTMPGPLINYGYEDQAALLMPVTSPALTELSADASATVNTSWLVCRESQCIPGRTAMTVPLRGLDTPQRIQHWQSLVPTPLPDSIPVDRTDSSVVIHVASLGPYVDVFPNTILETALVSSQISISGDDPTITIELSKQPEPGAKAIISAESDDGIRFHELTW